MTARPASAPARYSAAIEVAAPVCADSAHAARHRSTSRPDAPSASRVNERCKHESSSRRPSSCAAGCGTNPAALAAGSNNGRTLVERSAARRSERLFAATDPAFTRPSFYTTSALTRRPARVEPDAMQRRERPIRAIRVSSRALTSRQSEAASGGSTVGLSAVAVASPRSERGRVAAVRRRTS